MRLESAAAGKKQLAAVLPAQLPRRLCDALLTLAGLPVDRKAAALSGRSAAGCVAAVKRLRLPVTGTLGFGKAEVTAGGVALDEVDSRTMQSKLVPDLYLAGEILDLDGPIGGYNFSGGLEHRLAGGDARQLLHERNRARGSALSCSHGIPSSGSASSSSVRRCNLRRCDLTWEEAILRPGRCRRAPSYRACAIASRASQGSLSNPSD